MLYDVAVDGATGRVWGIAETSRKIGPEGSEGAKLWELFPGASPEQRFQLEPVGGGLLTVTKAWGYWLDYGNLAVDPTSRRIAVSSPSSFELAVLDLDTMRHVGSVFGPDYLYRSAAFDSLNGIGYGSSNTDGFAFRASDAAILGSTCQAYALAYSEANQRLYIGASTGSVIIFDPATGTCTPQILIEYNHPYPAFCGLRGIAVSPDGSRLFLSCTGVDRPLGEFVVPQPSFLIMDLASGMNLAQTEVPDPAGPHGFVVSPDSSTLYVTETHCNRVRVYDAKTGAFRHDIPTDGETLGIDLSADGSTLYVAQAHPDDPLGGGARMYGDFDALPECPPLVLKEP